MRPTKLAKCVCLLLTALVFGLSGCASQDREFDDELAAPASQLRSSKTAGQKLGLSARSRQIESDLGIE